MKKYIFTIISFILGISCFAAFALIGSKVAPDGRLIEPFALIPIGFLLTSISLIISFIQSTWALFHSPTKIDKSVFGISLALIILSVSYLTLSFKYLDYLDQQEISMIISIIKL